MLVPALAERLAGVLLPPGIVPGQRGPQPERSEDGPRDNEAKAAERLAARKWFGEGFREVVLVTGHGWFLASTARTRNVSLDTTESTSSLMERLSWIEC